MTKSKLVASISLIFLPLTYLGVVPTESCAAEAPPVRITVHAGAKGKPFSPTMHGIFFEDINYAADGGLYAELVQNRSFEHRANLFAWKTLGEGTTAEVESTGGLHTNNPTYCRTVVKEASGEAGMVNSGFDGFALGKGAKYLASIHLRAAQPAGEASIVLRDSDGAEVARAQFGEVTGEWKELQAELTSPRNAADATLEVVFSEPGQYDIDMVSLFPADTFRGRRNGLRKDLAQLVADMEPTFVRFPGGCIVEGRTLDNAYRWKDTVGPIWQRKQNYNLWANRQSPQYHQTYGLGYFEFFQYCEDIGAQPVPIVNCGMACQARGGKHAAMDELGPWVQDALDLVEFANGPVTSKWGKVRADMGRPEPFRLKYLGVGNEQWMEDYFERYQVFHSALKAQHKDLAIISTSGPQANDAFYRYAWDQFRSGVPADIVDEHYYRPPQWFLSNSDRYDNYNRSGPQVFAGEFAAHEADRASTLRAAVSEAAFMTGLWRNADVVAMSSYAPLFARVGSVQWAPDLIWFDNTRSYGTPSYYVQAMYGQHVPSISLPVDLDTSMIPPPEFHGKIGIGTWRTQAEFKDIRVTRGDEKIYESDGTLTGWDLRRGDWSAKDGVIRQTSEAENVRAFYGDPQWSDYTLSLKAKKTGGSEGFLVSFASRNPNETSWWNLGGWGNTEHGLEAPLVSQTRTPGKIERGRWYDIRIEVKGDSIVCYLDGKEVQRATVSPTPAVFAASGWDEDSEEFVIAVANPGDSAKRGQIGFTGGKLSGKNAQAFVLTSQSPRDVNSLANPQNVSPVEQSPTIVDGGVNFDLPACSFTILRVPGTRE